MAFAIEDQYSSNYLLVNKFKNVKQTSFLRCFQMQERVLADKTVNRENNSTGMIDSVKLRSCTDFIDESSLAYQVFIFCQKAS